MKPRYAGRLTTRRRRSLLSREMVVALSNSGDLDNQHVDLPKLIASDTPPDLIAIDESDPKPPWDKNDWNSP